VCDIKLLESMTQNSFIRLPISSFSSKYSLVALSILFGNLANPCSKYLIDPLTNQTKNSSSYSF